MAIELITDRLVLRPMGSGDVDSHITMMQDPVIAAFLTPEGKPRDLGSEWRMAAAMVGHWTIREFGFFSVFEKESGAWIGRVGPWQPGDWPGLEVGWAIASNYWGRGYAPEAALATMGWVFEKFPSLQRIISVIDSDNENSQIVAQKVGEEKTDEIFDFWGHKLNIWAVSRGEWLQKFG